MNLVYAVKNPGTVLTFPVKAGEKIEAGTCVGIDANGYAVSYVKNSADTYKGVFIALDSIDNTNGADGSLLDGEALNCILVYGYDSRLIVKSANLTQGKVLGNVYGGTSSLSDTPYTTTTTTENPLGILIASLGSNKAEILIK